MANFKNHLIKTLIHGFFLKGQNTDNYDFLMHAHPRASSFICEVIIKMEYPGYQNKNERNAKIILSLIYDKQNCPIDKYEWMLCSFKLKHDCRWTLKCCLDFKEQGLWTHQLTTMKVKQGLPLNCWFALGTGLTPALIVELPLLFLLAPNYIHVGWQLPVSKSGCHLANSECDSSEKHVPTVPWSQKVGKYAIIE